MYNCKYANYCGACMNLSMDYQSLLSDKTQYVKEIFKDFELVKVDDCVGNYYPLKYRNKIHLSFTELKGKTLIGFFEEGSTKVTNVDSCLLFGDWASKLISILREFVSRFKIRAYDKNGVGIIRYAHARCIDNKLQLTLVVTTENFAGRKWLYSKLNDTFTSVSLYLNINRRTDRAVFDKVFKYVAGERYLNFDFMGVKVSMTPSSFLQVNLQIASKIYKQAIDDLDIDEDTTVLDLYSGIGITSMLFSKKAKNVISIEEVEGAVENAKYIAKLNGVNNVSIFAGKCENIIQKIIKDNNNLVVFVDPARMGLDIEVINVIRELKPRKIVYMSCEPKTCVRDCKYMLIGNNYIINHIKCYDMFPYTKHVETLVCLQGRV